MLTIEFPDDERLKGSRIGVLAIKNARISPTEFAFEKEEKKVFATLAEQRSLETLKEEPVLRSFRDLYWRFNMDPTKLRVASEALLRRIIRERNLWRINNAIDVINLASAETGLPISAWDAANVKGQVIVRTAKKGERFLRIGAEEPALCEGNELVVADQEKILALGFATADCEQCKITVDTETVLVAIYATPAVSDSELLQAMKRVKKRIEEFVDGDVQRVGIFGRK